MAKYNYIKAPIEVAARAGLDSMRKPAGAGYVILSESDMRMIDLTFEEKVEFFGCEVVTEEQALTLINSIEYESEADNGNIDESDSAESGSGNTGPDNDNVDESDNMEGEDHE